MNAVLQDQPLPARLVPWPRALHTTLGRCLLLAVLLHLRLAAWVGTAPGGTAQLGQGVFGAINVTLRGPVSEGARVVELPPEPVSTAPGDAPTPRWGGAVRSAEPQPDSVPGAATLGLPAARLPEARRLAVPPIETAATAVAAPVPLPAPVAVPAPLPSAAPQLQQLPPLTPSPAWTAAPALPAQATLPSPAVLPGLPEPVAALAAPAPAPQRQLPSTLAAPTPAAPAAALPSAAAPLSLPELAAPERPLPAPPVLRQLATPPAALARTPEPALSAPDLPAAPAAALPPAVSLTGQPLPALGTAPADAGSRVGHDVATPPAAPSSAPPRLNLELARPRGGELSRYDTRGVLPVLPRPPERDEKLAREIEKAGKADCRTAYGGMGPLAVIPLAVDALRKEGGCKW
ncbi:MAG: hypothetical protein Q8R98_16535 [Rubrivivax sp.]|nr:hypothetical protein [Rubrivivax sp.]